MNDFCVCIEEHISGRFSTHTYNSKKYLIKLKYDWRMKVITHFIKIKTELGADILMILSLRWWL